jgi:DNA-binding NtrC family response regulator
LGVKLSILYLDDDASHLELFQEMFGSEYDVRTATTMAAAIELLTECAADIIISDQVMPEGTGTEFLRTAAQLCPASYRVLLTGAVTVGEVLPEVSAGIIQFFQPKPWTEAQMRAVLVRAAAYLDAPPMSPKRRRRRRHGNN